MQEINDVGLLVWMEGSVEACSAMKMRALVLRYLKLVLRLGCIWLRGKKKLKRKLVNSNFHGLHKKKTNNLFGSAFEAKDPRRLTS